MPLTLLAGMFVATVSHGTFGVGVRTDAKVVLAFDSGLFSQATNELEGEVCKLTRYGSTAFGGAGIAIDTFAGFDLLQIATRALRTSPADFKAQVDAVALELDRQAATLSVEPQETEFISILLAGVDVYGTPRLARLTVEKWAAASDGIRVGTEVFPSPGVEGGAEVFVVGACARTIVDCVAKDVDFWRTHGEENGARLLVERAIADHPAHVAGPVDVVCIDATGWTWLQRKAYCYERRED
jgi:hypothetical protein